MEPGEDLLSRLVAAIDRRMRRKLGIWEYSDDPDCIFRVGVAPSHWRVELSDGSVIERGEVIGVIHAWNERIPPLPPDGPDLAWARELWRKAVHSLRLLAQVTQEDPRLKDIRGFGWHGILEFSPGTMRLLERLGLEVYELPVRSLRDWVEEKTALVWTYLMRRTFNPPSTKGRGMDVLKRRFYWISRERFLALYGASNERQATSDER